MQDSKIRIGTRGSPLALAQAREVRARLMACHGLFEDAFEIVVIKTSGDRILDRPLAEVGGKGLFTKEIEDSLLSNGIDLAVHSMKDMATELPDGLVIGAVLRREDVRDAFISLKYGSIEDMPSGAVIGTSSLRRRAQVLKLRPDLKLIEFRGNVQTRIKKLREGLADATFLACAGLKRLGMGSEITNAIEISQMLPAVGQAVISVEVRAQDERILKLVGGLNDKASGLCVDAERAYLKRLQGSCRTPIGGYATLENESITMRGQILALDGQRSYEGERTGSSRKALEIGRQLADELLSAAGPGFLSIR